MTSKNEINFAEILKIKANGKSDQLLISLNSLLDFEDSNNEAKTEIQKFLMENFSVMDFYITKVQDNMIFLEKLHSKMGSQFTKELIHNENCRMIENAAEPADMQNFLPLIRCLKRIFVNDPEFWDRIVEDCFNIFFSFTRKSITLESNWFFELLDELKELETRENLVMLEKLFLSDYELSDCYESFILMDFTLKNELERNFILKLLDWMAKNMTKEQNMRILFTKAFDGYFWLMYSDIPKAMEIVKIALDNMEVYDENEGRPKGLLFEILTEFAFNSLAGNEPKLEFTRNHYMKILEETESGLEFKDPELCDEFATFYMYRNLEKRFIYDFVFKKVLFDDKFCDSRDKLLCVFEIDKFWSNAALQSFGNYIFTNYEEIIGRIAEDAMDSYSKNSHLSLIFHYLFKVLDSQESKENLKKILSLKNRSNEMIFDYSPLVLNYLHHWISNPTKNNELELNRKTLNDLLNVEMADHESGCEPGVLKVLLNVIEWNIVTSETLQSSILSQNRFKNSIFQTIAEKFVQIEKSQNFCYKNAISRGEILQCLEKIPLDLEFFEKLFLTKNCRDVSLLDFVKENDGELWKLMEEWIENRFKENSGRILSKRVTEDESGSSTTSEKRLKVDKGD